MKRAVPALWLGWILLACAEGRSSGARWSQDTSQAVVLLALDGMHPSYLDRAPSRHLRELAREGVRARWLVPVFPTLTFPNFYSIVTGLYPEHHGIVSNTMRDSVLGVFRLRDTAAVRDPRWWGGEPIWVTAVKQGRRAATFFWPGSEAPIGGLRPTYFKFYDEKVPNAERVRQVLEWLSLPSDRAPVLITLYLGDVDQAGHDFGPNAPETDLAIARVDEAVGSLMRGIEERGLSGRVNLVIVSDHGMAEVRPDHFIYLDDLIDLGSVDVVEWGPVVSLRARSGDQNAVYRRLVGAHPHLKVYRKTDIPAAYHYRAHPRIQPIIAVADEGWSVTTHAFAAERRQPRGMHGYPAEVASMRAIFLARGPAFKQGIVTEPFQNIQIYNLLANILCLEPAPNDGDSSLASSIVYTTRKRGAPPSCSAAPGRS